MTNSEIKAKFIKSAKDMINSEDHEGTWYVDLGTYNGKRFAIAMAFMDYNDEGDWLPYAKVACQPSNSIMQCDYDIDWEMPDVNGETFDSEVILDLGSLSSDADSLIQSWNVIQKALDLNEEKDLTEDNWAKIRPNIISDYIYEGFTFEEAIELAEDTVTPDTLYRLEQTPGYKGIRDEVAKFFKICDDVVDYKQTIFKDDPIEALSDEADFCEDVADFLGSIKLKGFRPEFTKDVMADTADSVQYLDNSVTRLRNILKKQDKSTYLDADGNPKPRTNQRPGEYARRALRALGQFFGKFGIEFDYDPDFDYSKTKDVDYRNLVADYESKEINEAGKHCSQTVEVEISFGINDEDTLVALNSFLKEHGFATDSSLEEGWISAVCDETGTYYYTPEKHTGIMTGDPEIYEIEDLSTRSDIEELLKPLYDKYKFTIDSIHCSLMDEFI